MKKKNLTLFGLLILVTFTSCNIINTTNSPFVGCWYYEDDEHKGEFMFYDDNTVQTTDFNIDEVKHIPYTFDESTLYFDDNGYIIELSYQFLADSTILKIDDKYDFERCK